MDVVVESVAVLIGLGAIANLIVSLRDQYARASRFWLSMPAIMLATGGGVAYMGWSRHNLRDGAQFVALCAIASLWEVRNSMLNRAKKKGLGSIREMAEAKAHELGLH